MLENGNAYISGNAAGGFERSTNGGDVYVKGTFPGNDNFGNATSSPSCS